MASKSKKMSDNELLAVVGSYENDSVSYNSEFMLENEEFLRRYKRECYGDEEEGYSQTITSDVQDVVDSDMTSLVRVFMGSGDIMVFSPYVTDQEAIDEAKAKTQYINYLVQRRADSYKINHDLLQDIEIQKFGASHYFMDDIKDTKELHYKKLSIEDITELLDTIEEDDETVIKSDIVEKEDLKDGTFNVRIRITTKRKELIIQNIPTESFLLSRNASSLDEALMVGHVSWPTRSELVMGGMSEEKVDSFPTSSPNSVGSNFSEQDSNNQGAQAQNMKAIRFRDQGGDFLDGGAADYSQWASQTVRMVTMVAKVDFDGDGIAERRWIVKIGNEITENEPYDHIPYAVGSALLESHKAIGTGRASLAIEDQSVNTAITRAVQDNLYDVVHPQKIVGDGVNLNDLFDQRSNGVVRMKSGSAQAPSDGISQLTTPYIGNEALQWLQYRDQLSSDRSGTLISSQGLEAGQLAEETATRFNGMEKASEAKIELVARNIAEVYYRKLYEGIEWTLNRFQDKEQQIVVAGRALAVNPSDWKFPTLAVSQVGLGAGSGDKTVEQMTGVFQIQNMLKAEGSLMVDDDKRYNTLNRMLEGLGLSGTQLYFNDPEQPEAVVIAQNEALMAALQQSQQMIEQLTQQNPLAEAEQVKAMATLEVNREKNQLNAAIQVEKNRLEEAKIIQDGSQHEDDLTLDYTRLELENNVDIPGKGANQ